MEAEVDYMEVMEADQSGTSGSHQLLVLRSLDKISEAATTEGYEHTLYMNVDLCLRFALTCYYMIEEESHYNLKDIHVI